MEEEEAETITCHICGEDEDLMYNAFTNKYLRENKVCFDCYFGPAICYTITS